MPMLSVLSVQVSNCEMISSLWPVTEAFNLSTSPLGIDALSLGIKWSEGEMIRKTLFVTLV